MFTDWFRIILSLDDTRERYSVTQTLRSKARPASLQTGEMQNAPRRPSDTVSAGTTKSKPLTASGGAKIDFRCIVLVLS